MPWGASLQLPALPSHHRQPPCRPAKPLLRRCPPLEDLLGQYQRGAQLLAFCRERLQAVEEQVKRLDGDVLRPLTQGDEA